MIEANCRVEFALNGHSAAGEGFRVGSLLR